jgi:plastocyanin
MMSRKHRAVLSILATAVAIPATAAAAGPQATLTIRHQVHGCHAWSFNGSPYKAAQTISLRRGTTLTVVDYDVMSHTLFQKGGPTVRIASPAMNMKTKATVTFARPGTYTFGTRPGEDYKGVKAAPTVGRDNVLSLVVHVA